MVVKDSCTTDFVVVHAEEGMVVGAGISSQNVVGDEQVGVAHILRGLREVADGHNVRLNLGLRER